jgi:FlaG/FlaF family flagellin (archaellin)
LPEPIELESATNYFVTAAWVVGAVVIAYAIGSLVSWLVQRAGRRSAVLRDVALLTRSPVRATLMVIAASMALQRSSDAGASWRGWLDHLLVILLIGAVTWVVASLVVVVERQAIVRFAGGDAGLTDADRHRRKIRTQVTVLRRLTIAVVVVLGGAAAMMTFPSFSDIGKTLFASAGVLSVVAGLAAQTSLGAAFAGIQIAFSDAIRVGDVVVLEDEWGRIEEITLTYVVVHVWDERRLVLPCTYFTTTPFQNWTRSATELLGTAEVDVDFTVPFDAMRVELNRLLKANPRWDQRVGVLQVTDTVDGYVRVRMLVSATDAPTLFDLRCDVREGMVEWLQREHPGALPRRRLELGSDQPVESSRRTSHVGEPKADSGLFSGSPEAERRSREFDLPDDDDGDDRNEAGGREFARARYDGA